MTTKNRLLYPYGAETLSTEYLARDEVERYNRHGAIGTDLPLRHPLLLSIPEEFELQKALPKWWKDGLSSMDFNHALLLKTVTAEQFYEGNADTTLIKKLRTVLSEEEKRELPQSPSIAKWLSAYPELLRMYNDRGGTEKGTELVGKLVTLPSETFYMSNGKGWSSCQHWKGSYASRLTGTMFDPYAVLATIQQKGKAINESVNKRGEDSDDTGGTLLARAVLRLMYFIDKPYILIDRMYGVDTGLIEQFTRQVYNHLENNGFNPALTSHASYGELTGGQWGERDLETLRIVSRDDISDPYLDSVRAGAAVFFNENGMSLKARRWNGTGIIADKFLQYE